MLYHLDPGFSDLILENPPSNARCREIDRQLAKDDVKPPARVSGYSGYSRTRYLSFETKRDSVAKKHVKELAKMIAKLTCQHGFLGILRPSLTFIPSP